MELDLRTRTVEAIATVDPRVFHTEVIGELLSRRGDLATRAFEASGLSSITISVSSDPWTWRLDDDGGLEIVSGDPGTGASFEITPDWFSDIVNDLRSTVALMISGEAEVKRGNITHLVSWEPVLRALVDGRAAYQAGLVDFVGLDGAPLDLTRRFALGDDPREVAHFVAQTGFAHFTDVFSPVEMEALSREIDRWRSEMTSDDDRGWFAKVGDEHVCVRVTNLGPTAVEFPHEQRLSPIVEMLGGQRQYRGSDLLVKPVGVSEGISDLPWHKDCALGGHSYRCASITCGVSVTASGSDNGRLGVVAGSHRVNLASFDLPEGIDLPVIWLDTDVGDVTVHVSCALHCATPPQHSERRVTYSDFPFAGSDEVDRTIRAVRDQAGRDTYSPV